jgi:hypothetical protein
MKIFISYAKNGTRDLALQLRQALESQDGITAWMDDSLLAGANWKRQIQDEIKRCDLVIVLLSPDVNRETEPNSFVLNEIGYAQQLEKPLLPVLAQHTELPIDFANTHYVDLTQSGASVDAVVDAVRSRITPPANPFPVNAEGEEQHLTRTQRHTRVQPTSQSQSVFNPATGEDELVPRIDFSLFSPVKIDETGFVQVGELP